METGMERNMTTVLPQPQEYDACFYVFFRIAEDVCVARAPLPFSPLLSDGLLGTLGYCGVFLFRTANGVTMEVCLWWWLM